ncbi:MAG: PIN domain-containing protein [Actinomycetota bacterium]
MEPKAIGVEVADTSVWARHGKPGLEWFGPALEDGRIAVCDMVVMELLWSARDIADFRATETALLACPWLSIEPPDWDEARRIFRELAAGGPLHHRQVKIPDLLIAAVAARNALTIVHYDSDYDIIASVTGQPTRWGAPRGSI